MPAAHTPQRVTSTLHHKQHLRFSPDGSRLLYARTIGPRINLVAVAGDGAEQPLFPDRQDYIQQHPAWSPDGTRFAFTANDGYRNLRIGVLVCDADGMALSNVRPWLMGGQDSHATWSPDGARVAFIAGNQRLMIANADGSDRKLLGPPEGISGQPNWSPQGDRIAFSSSHENGFEVYSIQPDGGGLTRLTDHARVNYRPVYSPDGDWLAFTSARDGDYEVYVMRPDGGEMRNVTVHPGLDDHAAWSPDGRELAFVSTRDGGYDVYRLPFEQR